MEDDYDKIVIESKYYESKYKDEIFKFNLFTKLDEKVDFQNRATKEYVKNKIMLEKKSWLEWFKSFFY
jgi:hypothetical protein